MTTENTGITSSALLRRLGSPPAIAPMIRELTASPIQPQVMANPMAVPVIRGNTFPTIASVVGNTGAIDTPARNTRIQAPVTPRARRASHVVSAMAAEAARVTV